MLKECGRRVESGFAAGCRPTAEGKFGVTDINLFKYIFNLCNNLIIVDTDSTVSDHYKKCLKGKIRSQDKGTSKEADLGGHCLTGV